MGVSDLSTATPKDRKTESTALHTIRDAVEGPHGLGITQRDGEIIVIVRLDSHDKPINHLYPNVADELIGENTFITTGRMKTGTIGPKTGRKGENVASIPTLPVDCDLPDLTGLTQKRLHMLPPGATSTATLTNCKRNSSRAVRRWDCVPPASRAPATGYWDGSTSRRVTNIASASCKTSSSDSSPLSTHSQAVSLRIRKSPTRDHALFDFPDRST